MAEKSGDDILLTILRVVESNDKRLERIEVGVGQLEKRMDSFEERMDSLEKKMDKLERRVAGLESRVDDLEESLHNTNGTLSLVARVVHEMTQTISSRFENQEARMLKLEAHKA